MYEELKKLAESRKAAGWLSIDSVSIKQLLALIAENERLECMLENYKIDAKVYKDSADQLKADNEALRKDAERYRFLRDGPDDIDFSGVDTVEDMDEAIDSAMSKDAASEA